MKQAIMPQPGIIEFRDIPRPKKIGPEEILLAIKRIGVCGSDVHVFHGKHPFTPYPVVQGHEFSAVVEKVGERVAEVKPGNKATARPQLVCGRCRPCLRGHYNICDHLKVQGFQAPGVAQEFFVTEEERIVPFPDEMTFEQGALIEPIAVGAHSTRRASDLEGKNVVVLGAGTIGNFVAQIAKIRNARKVLITDLSDFRLEKAKACGIENASNAQKETLAEAVARVFGDEGFDIAFEAVGVESTMDAAIQNIQKGGEIVVLGVFGQRPRIDMSTAGDHEVSIIGSLMYKHEDYEEAVQFIAGGKIITEPLITRHFPFQEYYEAYRFIEQQGDQALKVMIDL